MNCRKVVLGTLFVLSLSLGAAAMCAQEEPPPTPDAPPKPAGYSFPGIGIGQQEGDLQPDSSPLTGMQNATLGLPEIRHSYWVPGVQFSSNEYSNSGGSGWTSDNFFIGNLSLVQAWNRALLAVNYSGGGYVSALQATYALSRRSSVTVAGSYGLLRFEQGNYDSNTTVASAGYNYQLTRNDTLGLAYRCGP